MRCLLGGPAQDIIDKADARYRLTSSTSGKIMDYFNSQGGNTPLKNTTVASGSEDSWFDKAFGIVGKLLTPASVAAPTIYKVNAAPVPYVAFAGVALAAFFIYKVAK